MVITRAIIIYTLLLSTAFAMSSVSVEDFKWKNRLLVYFYLSEDEKRIVEGQTEKHLDAIKDRDILVGYVRLHKPSSLGSLSLEEDSIKKLVSGLSIVENQSTLVLIGKDGTIKFHGSSEASLSEIFALIDSMPMRKREMSRQGLS